MMVQSVISCCEIDAKPSTQSILKRQCQKFLARKIHKLKKILKLRSKPSASISELSLEERQNAENERLNEKLYAGCPCEVEQNSINENWENWDACQMCAITKETTNAFDDDHFTAYQQPQSICYVFMPNQSEPVPVRLRTARIPGGVMCVSYRPDVDIRSNSNYLYSYTSFQQPQAQQALRPIMV